MKCKECGAEFQEGKFCPECGTEIEKENSDEGLKEEETQKEKTEQDFIQGNNYANMEKPVERKIANGKIIRHRSFWKYILLSFVTCGIYGIYAMYTFTEDVNSLCEGDGKKSPNYIIVLLLGLCTLGIYGLYWWYRQAERLKEAAPRYGIEIRESGSTILCWQIFGSLLFSLGPFVSTYIMFDNVNYMSLVYNGEKSAEEVRAMGTPHAKLVRNVLCIAGGILGVLLLLTVLILGSIFMLMSDSEPKEDEYQKVEKQVKEKNVVEDFSDMDFEEVLGSSEEELETLGLSMGDDFLDYGALEGAVQVLTEDGIVSSVMLMDDAENTPSVHGIRIGMTLDEAQEKAADKYSEVIEADESRMFLNPESRVYIHCSSENGVIASILYEVMDEETYMEYQAEQEEALRAEYIFPDSSAKYLSEDEVRSVEVGNLYIGRNEIFARHGYIFGDANLQQHFEATSWYQGSVAADQFNSDAVFNDFEKKNVELIKRIEDEINKPAKEPFIGMEGDYLSLNSSNDDITGRVLILDIGEDSLQFSLGALQLSYYVFDNYTAEIIDDHTAQATIDGLTTITFDWSDPENMVVTNSGIMGDWMDAAVIDIATSHQRYYRSLEFNQ